MFPDFFQLSDFYYILTLPLNASHLMRIGDSGAAGTPVRGIHVQQHTCAYSTIVVRLSLSGSMAICSERARTRGGALLLRFFFTGVPSNGCESPSRGTPLSFSSYQNIQNIQNIKKQIHILKIHKIRIMKI